MRHVIEVREDAAVVLRLLREALRLIERHPRLVRAVLAAFIAEGRRFAATSEGEQMRASLLRSERFRRARLIWEAFGLDRQANGRASFEPSRWIGTLVAATASANLEGIIAALMMEAGR
jgi:hypothetical protein